MLAAIGQLAAVFVGIPSLIYLATQIREQTKERRQSAVHALTVQWGDLTESLHDNAETAAIFLRGMVLNGALYRGHFGIGAEFGHMPPLVGSAFSSSGSLSKA